YDNISAPSDSGGSHSSMAGRNSVHETLTPRNSFRVHTATRSHVMSITIVNATVGPRLSECGNGSQSASRSWMGFPRGERPPVGLECLDQVIMPPKPVILAL